MSQPKPFAISKRSVWEAYKRVKANRGAAGVDGQSIEEFEQNLSGNLYKLWNRLASGSYMPPAVRRVEIPKASGGTRPLGIPTVADRIAQMVVKDALEPILEPGFHADSYGYRPNKSAHDALAAARQRCWRADWVLDVDIKGFFDNIDHTLLMKAVRKHTDCKWVVLYIERWLTAPVQMPGGTLQARDRGTPQGGVISPLLANLFLHRNLQRRSPITLEEIARQINPVLQGWVNYYGRFYQSVLYPVMEHVDLHLAKWLVRKHKRARRSLARAFEWLRRIRRDCPALFVHWRLAYEG